MGCDLGGWPNNGNTRHDRSQGEGGKQGEKLGQQASNTQAKESKLNSEETRVPKMGRPKSKLIDLPRQKKNLFRILMVRRVSRREVNFAV